jgi:hypothetical protein
MPSSAHAILVELFRARPSLVTALLRHCRLRVPRGVTAEVSESTFPASIADTHADAVIVLRGTDSEPRLVVVVEVQLAVDAEKPRRWLTYQVAAEQRHACMTVVFVVAPDARVARWARKPRAVGPRGNFAPLVLGPDEVPRIADLTDVERSAELAVLSLLAHRRDANRDALRVATAALVADGGDRASLYFDLLHATFGQALSRAVEDLMMNGEPLSEWARAHYRQGRAEGEAAGKAESALAVLTARGLTLLPEERRTILACADLERLDRWIAAALTVRSVAELLTQS